MSATTASAKDLNAGSASLKVTAEVRNTGGRPVDEVVQLYIRQTGTSVVRPVRELKGFQRLTLAAGQSQKVEFTLGRDELKFWNIDMKDVVEPAQLTVWIAPDSTKGTPARSPSLRDGCRILKWTRESKMRRLHASLSL